MQGQELKSSEAVEDAPAETQQLESQEVNEVLPDQTKLENGEYNEERKYIETIGNQRLSFLLVFIGFVLSILGGDASHWLKIGTTWAGFVVAMVFSLAIHRSYLRSTNLRNLYTAKNHPLKISDAGLLMPKASFHKWTCSYLPFALAGGMLVLSVLVTLNLPTKDQTTSDLKLQLLQSQVDRNAELAETNVLKGQVSAKSNELNRRSDELAAARKALAIERARTSRVAGGKSNH
ncbi:MAG: hypothetical protein JSS66_11010 [Armatimonadetes bacterium]|nr:hypothetical protein [Armatimonadota bacterium]